MSSINGVDGATYQSTASMQAENSMGGMGKDDFLNLLITQLSNQDPLNPMESEAFIAQLAQFSSLEQLISVNERLDGLAMGQLSQSGASAIGFIGKDVRAMADWVETDGEAPTDINFDLLANSDSVTITIKDEDGNLIRNVDLTGLDEGEQSWLWDGTNRDGSMMDAGTYTISIKATDADGNKIGAYPVSEGRITGVTYENGYPVLRMGDHDVPLSDVIEIKEE